MTDTLSNFLPSRGIRKPLQIDVDDNGIEGVPANEKRNVIVLYNVGPNTAWANTTLATANPDEGIPIKNGGALIDGDSNDAWYFGCDTGETADLRGWEVERP